MKDADKQKETAPDSHVKLLRSLRALLVDTLEAGRYLPPEAKWEPHNNGELLCFRDRSLDAEHPGALVLAEEVTQAIASSSVDNPYASYIVVGARVNEEVDLGKSRLERLRHVKSLETHYWATYVLENSVLVTLGTPPSPCRLIGEVLNLQAPMPFVQSRICAHCYALNDYHSLICTRCNKPLTVTGRLGE